VFPDDILLLKWFMISKNWRPWYAGRNMNRFEEKNANKCCPFNWNCGIGMNNKTLALQFILYLVTFFDTWASKLSHIGRQACFLAGVRFLFFATASRLAVTNPVTWVYVYEVSTKILKISARFISSPLSYIFNKSMLSGTLSTRLKYAIVKPLLKKGDKENIANYRPISLLTSFSKVFERIICDRLLKQIIF